MTGSPGRLVAARFALDPGPSIDPFALAGTTGILFHAEGRVLVGLGTALDIELPDGLDGDGDGDVRLATRVLTSLPCDDHFGSGSSPSSGVIGFGSFPFDRSAPTALVVPKVVYCREADGREWVTAVAATGAALPSSPVGLRSWLVGGAPTGGLDGPSSPTPAAVQPVSGSARPRVEPRSTDASFLGMVAEGLAAIDRGDVVKVVLSRQVDVLVDAPVDVPALLRRWHGLEPGCTVFSIPTPDGQFVGASPELLVERSGSRIRSRPLAGTAERFIGAEGSVLPGELLESTKDATEHGLVVDAIDTALRPLCSDLQAPSGPDLVRLRSIVHLGTSLSGTLARRADGGLPDVLELVKVLHPTPAVGGVPAPAARALIRRLEPESRGHYAGPVGYVDAAGDGRWMVGIRAMTVDGRTARMAAGVGIVTGSTPATELAETGLKLTAVLDALDPPVLQVQ